jgi:hypothetical protein
LRVIVLVAAFLHVVPGAKRNAAAWPPSAALAESRPWIRVVGNSKGMKAPEKRPARLASVFRNTFLMLQINWLETYPAQTGSSVRRGFIHGRGI